MLHAQEAGVAVAPPSDVLDVALTDVSLPTLSRRDGGALNALYARQPFRCRECGLRFPAARELTEHRAAAGHSDAAGSHSGGGGRERDRDRGGGKAPPPVRHAIVSRDWWPRAEAWLADGGAPAGGRARAAAAAGAGSAAAGAGSGFAGVGASVGAGLFAGGSGRSGAGGSTSLFAGLGAYSRQAGGGFGGSADGENGGAGLHDDARSVGSSDSDSEHVVPAYDPAATCAVCGEGFNRRWDEDAETWVLKGAVMLAEDVYHTACASSLDPFAAAAGAVGSGGRGGDAGADELYGLQSHSPPR
jgi:hypothetical protein